MTKQEAERRANIIVSDARIIADVKDSFTTIDECFIEYTNQIMSGDTEDGLSPYLEYVAPDLLPLLAE